MFTKKTKKEVVYSSTDMTDLLSSPVFYSVIAFTFILGLASIFGYLNNPRKLKTMVDAVNQKILVNPNSNTVSFDTDEEYLLRKYSLKNAEISYAWNPLIIDDKYNISSKEYSYESSAEAKIKKLEKVSFDYDVTSKQFWSDFEDTTSLFDIEPFKEKNRNPIIIGAPLSSDYHLDNEEQYSKNMNILRL